MKNSYVRYFLQFTLMFFIGGLFIAVGGEDTPPIWDRSIGDYLSEVLFIVLFGTVVFTLPMIYRAKRVGNKHEKYHKKYSIPYANDKGECYCGQ